MRHRKHFRKLNRTSEHRRAMLRNMAQNLIEHGQITTTLAKAKTLKPYIERIVSLAVRTRRRAAEHDPAGALRARRRIHRLLGDRGLVPAEHRNDFSLMSDAGRAKTMRMPSGRRYRTGEPKGRLAFTAESVAHRLVDTVAARFENRPGGYTRLIRLARSRIGDAAPLAVLQFVGAEEAPVSLAKPAKSARRRRADARYSMAVQAAKEWGRSDKSKTTRSETKDDAPAPPDDPNDQAADTGEQPGQDE